MIAMVKEGIIEFPIGEVNAAPSEKDGKTGFSGILCQVGESLDQLRRDRSEIEVSLGREIEVLETDLIRMTVARNRAVQQANAEKMRVEALERELSEIERRSEALSLRTHILVGQVENAVKSKDDMQNQLNASEARRNVLERTGRIKDLCITKLQLEKEEAVRDGGIFAMVGSLTSSGMIAGVFVAGPLGAVVFSGIALTGSTLGAVLFSDINKIKNNKKQLLEVDREIADLARNDSAAVNNLILNSPVSCLKQARGDIIPPSTPGVPSSLNVAEIYPHT